MPVNDLHTKRGFIALLKRWVRMPDETRTVSAPLKQYLLWFFEQDWIMDRLGISFLHSVPALLIEAIEEFRVNQEPRVADLRARYLAIIERQEVPSLVDIEFNLLERSMLSDGLCRELALLVGESWFEKRMRSVVDAQSNVLQQASIVFATSVYRRGLYDRYQESWRRGMKGQFSQTELRVWASAGRLMLTFARPRQVSEIEHSVSFIGEDDNPYTGFGTQSCHTDLSTALAMINDVMRLWPKTKPEQRLIFRGDEKVKLDVVAALEAAGQSSD